MGWWSDIFRKRAEDWTYGELQPSQVPDGLSQRPVAADEEYLDVFVHSLRIADVRKGVSRFYGTVHSLISLPSARPDGPVEFHALTTPEELRNTDAKNLHRVLVVDQRVLGPVPYRGGDLEVELGLFSVKSADLADPFLSVLEELSSLAGVSFVTVAKPFVAPLKRGIDLLTGADGANILEIGLAKTFPQARTGYFLVMRAPVGSVPVADLKLGSDGKLLLNGAPVEKYPYIVLKVGASSVRPDWQQIPDIAEPYKILDDAVRRRNRDDVKEALGAFKVAALWSPDLLNRDAKRINELVETRVTEAEKAAQMSTEAVPGLPPLAELTL